MGNQAAVELSPPKSCGSFLTFSASKVNRALAQAAQKLGNVTVVDMTALYPDGEIRLDVEVQRLLKTEKMILQFPVQ